MIKLILSALLLISCIHVFGQRSLDSTFVGAAADFTIDRYRKAIGVQAKLYNGSRYLAPKESVDQHPYFQSNDWIFGDVVYDGENFKNVPLMFDLFNTQLVTEHPTSGQPIQLIRDKLNQFSIGGHFFKRIENESVKGSLPATDFYDILYDGDTKVIARHQKLLREKIESNQVITTYEDRTRYFIFKNSVFFPVKSKASVLKVLEDQKQNLKKFLKKNKIVFSLDRETALKKIAEVYDDGKPSKL